MKKIKKWFQSFAGTIDDNKFICFFSFLFLCAAFFAIINYPPFFNQHFSYLALSFLKGKLYFIDLFGGKPDTVFFQGKYYWPLGPFPAVTLIPFVFIFNTFGYFFDQGIYQFILGVYIFCLCFKISKKIGYPINNSLYWAFGFVFSSMFIGVFLFPSSWFFAQVVTVFLLFLLIEEYLSKKRYLVLGLLTGTALVTRVTAGMAAFFFVLFIIIFTDREKKYFKRKVKDCLFFLIFPSVFFILILVYNYLRFGNIFEVGYSIQSVFPGALEKAKEYGIYNLIHIPGNIYYSLLSLPLPVFKDSLSHVLKFPYLRNNDWGISIFLTSPYLLYLFVLKYRDIFSKILISVILITAFNIYMYYGIGYMQFGYRYFLDIMPFLFLLLMKNYRSGQKNLSRFIKFLIISSALFNLYLLITWSVY